jgi:hypothetical protein
MKRLYLLALLVGCSATCMEAAAASMAANVPVIWQLSGKVYVAPGNIQWDGPATTCTPATPMFMVDPNTSVGRAQFALLVTAKEANHRVYLVGDGACVGGGPNGWQAESLVGIQLQP